LVSTDFIIFYFSREIKQLFSAASLIIRISGFAFDFCDLPGGILSFIRRIGGLKHRIGGVKHGVSSFIRRIGGVKHDVSLCISGRCG
jgi:hypothetical protein